MEWVEITAETVTEARELALDRLGVDEQDAEIEVLAEPSRRLFRRSDARIRARIVPKAPREKRDRRRGGKGGGGGRGRSGNRSGGGRGGTGGTRSGNRARATASVEGSSAEGSPEPRSAAAAEGDGEAGGAGQRPGGGSGSGGRRRRRGRGGGGASRPSTAANGNGGDEVPMKTLDEQVEMAEEFLDGLLEAFGLEGDISRVDVDDELVELQVGGEDLGLLIGRRGSTIQAVNEVMRTGLQRQAGGTAEGRVRVDIGGYRERRREALARFAVEQAQSVLDSGEERALEPMNSADRKVVHDAINEVDGVETLSEGAEPRRWVVIVPTD
ncbi:MAG: RNA-binding cell elongation regulator Jag/EloR [Actinomycetota bacterium]